MGPQTVNLFATGVLLAFLVGETCFPLGILRPRRGLIWRMAVRREAAEVKPAITGIEMNSRKKP